MNWTPEQIDERNRKQAAQGFVEALRPLSVADTYSEAAYQHIAGPIRKQRARPERDLEKACSQILQLDDWRMLKTDPCSDRSRGKGFGEKGMADCLYIRYTWAHLAAHGLRFDYKPATVAECHALTHTLWIEWKGPKGVATVQQGLWIAAERARGALVWLAGVDFPCSVEGFLQHYRESGLMRRRC